MFSTKKTQVKLQLYFLFSKTQKDILPKI